MRTPSQPPVRHILGLLAVVIAALVLATPVATAAPAANGRTTAASGTRGLVASTASRATATTATTAADAALPVDQSTQLPRAAHDETVGDFLGAGYNQRAVVRNGNLLVYNPPSRGGNLVQTTRTDLTPAGPAGTDGHGHLLPLWQGGAINDVAAANRLASVYLVWTPEALYLAGSSGVGGPLPDYHTTLYKVSPDGKCASRSCAIWTTELGSYYNYYPPFTERVEGVTALAVGKVWNKTVVAIGISDTSTNATRFALDGVLFVEDVPTHHYVTNGYVGFGAQQPNQVAVTALAWSPARSGETTGMLAVGTTSPTHAINAIKYGSDGRLYYATHWDSTAGDDYAPSALSAAVTNRADGSAVMAFGMSDGTVKMWDPAATSPDLIASAPSTGTGTTLDAVDALTYVDRVDGSSGLPDLVAASSNGDRARVLRYSGATTLAAQPVLANAATVVDLGTIRQWFPGRRTGALQVFNASHQAVSMSFASRPNAAYGCWSAPAFAGPPARTQLPAASVNLAYGVYSPLYSTGGFTAGQNGACATTDSTGQWAVYLVVSPIVRPADRTTAKLVWSRSGDLTVTQVGGSLSLDKTKVEVVPAYSLGKWGITINGPSPTTGGALVTPTIRRLDPAGVDRPVYRIDVPAYTYALPVSSPLRISTELPAMVVQGSAPDTGGFLDLGRLIPQGQPTRATDGSVTVAPVSFYWQFEPGGPAYDTFRLTLLGRAASNPVSVASALPPTDGTHVGQLVVCPATGSGACSGVAQPYANGLDQAPLKIQIYDDNGTVLPVTDPDYGRVYYRDDDGDLVTGLIPLDGSSYVRVSPYPGEYSNDGAAGSIVRPSPTAPVGGRYGYLSTSSTLSQGVTAHVGGSDVVSDAIAVSAQTLSPVVPTGSRAADGFYVNGCTDYAGSAACRLAVPTAAKPALFMSQDSAGHPAVGLMLRTLAQTALTTLPLQQVTNQPEHNLAAATLNINNGEVSMDTTSGFQPADALDVYVVTHGTSYQVRKVTVGGGN